MPKANKTNNNAKKELEVGDIIRVKRNLIRKEKTLKGFNLYTVVNNYRVNIWRNTLELIGDDMDEVELQIVKEIDLNYTKLFVARLNIKS
ncbi:MAG: hypothetical protein ACPL1F_04695 [bacterium]